MSESRSESPAAATLGVVVVTHGQLATELVNAAEMIVGELPRFAAVSIGWHDDVDAAKEAIGQAIDRVRGTAGILLLTDMFGGTPSNLALSFLDAGRCEVITGVNLPMLIKLASLRTSQDMLAVAREMREHGRNAIWVASDLVRPAEDLPVVIARRVVRVGNPLGMHARAAARFARVASQFEARITVERGWRSVDAKSILGLLLLSAAHGTEIAIAAEGQDAERAVGALGQLVTDGCHGDDGKGSERDVVLAPRMSGPFTAADSCRTRRSHPELLLAPATAAPAEQLDVSAMISVM